MQEKVTTTKWHYHWPLAPHYLYTDSQFDFFFFFVPMCCCIQFGVAQQFTQQVAILLFIVPPAATVNTDSIRKQNDSSSYEEKKLRPLMVNRGNTSLERRGHTAAALVLLTDLSDSCCSASSSYVWTLNSRLSALRVQPAKVKDKQRNWNTWENKKESRSSCVVPPRVAQSSDNKAEGIGASTGGERLGELTTRKLRPPLGKYWTGLRTFAAAV